VLINNEVGVRINKSFWSLIEDGRDYDNFFLVECDVWIYVTSERKALGKEGDVKVLLSYIACMRGFNNDFYF